MLRAYIHQNKRNLCYLNKHHSEIYIVKFTRIVQCQKHRALAVHNDVHENLVTHIVLKPGFAQIFRNFNHLMVTSSYEMVRFTLRE